MVSLARTQRNVFNVPKPILRKNFPPEEGKPFCAPGLVFYLSACSFFNKALWMFWNARKPGNRTEKGFSL
jgi:hypothetical protein